MELNIATIGHRGEGVARHKGEPVFVPFVLPGEIVEVAEEGERIAVERILKASPDRVAPVCAHFGRCGGCALQHWTSAPYRAWKRDLVVRELAHRGIEAEVEPLVDAHGAGRRRATFHMRGGRAGFMEQRSHTLCAVRSCPVLERRLDRAVAIANEIAMIVGTGDASFTATDGGLDVAVKSERSRARSLASKLGAMPGVARLTINGETVVDRGTAAIRIGRATVRLPPSAFIQATEAGELALHGFVRDSVAGARKIADLFCGVGPFALRLAEAARLLAVDSDRSAIAALERAARDAAGLKPLSAECRDLFREPLSALELGTFDAVVFDPSRAGAEAQARQLARSAVETVVAISCDTGTFARDAAILIEGGYRLETVRPIDQFRYTPHVEIAARFRRPAPRRRNRQSLARST